MNSRAQAIAEIESLNALNGHLPDSLRVHLLLSLLAEIGLNALRDDAVMRYAELYQEDTAAALQVRPQ
jgi:hypothetical protein